MTLTRSRRHVFSTLAYVECLSLKGHITRSRLKCTLSVKSCRSTLESVNIPACVWHVLNPPFWQHVENVVPELGRFFNAMLEDAPEKRLTARQALVAFNDIYKSLSCQQLNTEVNMLLWENGR